MIIKLDNVRIAFPQLFTAAAYAPGQAKTYDATFLLNKNKHKALITQIKKATDKIAITELKLESADDIRTPLMDGDKKKKYDGFKGHLYITSHAKKRPSVINRDKSPLTEEDDVIYGGCYVNGSIELWGQNNQFGKAVNASLRIVQFVRDGESFGGGTPVDLDTEFEALDEEETADLFA